MPEEHLSLFHEELLLFLQTDLQKKIQEEGWDERIDNDMREYRHLLSKALTSSAEFSLQKIIERYHYLFTDRGPIQLEHQLFSAFPAQELKSIGFMPLRMYRGLPRVYHKDNPSISRIKPGFSHLPSLKQIAIEPMIASLYAFRQLPAPARVVLLTYVFPDGLGDLYAGLETKQLLSEAFTDLEIEVFALYEKPLPPMEGIRFLKADREARWSQEDLKCLRTADCILEIPTSYPYREELQSQVRQMEDATPFPKWELIGEYGFIESNWCHPQTKACSMGLHFLERGILVRKTRPFLKEAFDNPELFAQIFKDQNSKEKIRSSRRFFFAYLFSASGIFVYLHALFKSLEADSRDIDLCFPDPVKFLAYLQDLESSEKKILEKSYGIGEVCLFVDSKTFSFTLSKNGKKVRIFCPESLSQSDCQRYISLSEDFVACRGDQSFSEVVSLNKVFFYESRSHARYFIKDLLALAENRISQYRSTLGILRLYVRLLEQTLSDPDTLWVDEIYFQKEQQLPLLEIAERIGVFLQHPDAILGFKKLNRLLVQEYSCNCFLINFVKRCIVHAKDSEIALIEQREVSEFCLGNQTVRTTISKIKESLSSLKTT